MEKDLARAEIIVTGSVQGVFYRASTFEKAQGLNLLGWVKNLPCNSVEIVAEGPRYALEELVAWAKVGPPDAVVDTCDVVWKEYVGQLRTFSIEY